ncbi:MAG: DUF4185 domain-containing protein [Deltaproteobacteria bacterium]|nr:DUF4185 domain-containing protein [Deltaproteobacteria bacterium]
MKKTHSCQYNHVVNTRVGRRPGYRAVLVFVILLLSACAGQHHPPRFTVEPLPLYEALFQRDQGWTGGDGVFSVGLDPHRVLWLFGDTFIGEIKEGQHVNFVLVNNTIAVQRGTEPIPGNITFYYGDPVGGKPQAFLRPADEGGWFWPYHGVRTREGLFLFLIQVELSDGPPAFNFRTVATWLALVSNPDDRPEGWQVLQRKVPWSGENRLFGSAVLVQGENCYIFGTVDEVSRGVRQKQVILARVPAAQLLNFSQWRFFANGEWVAEAERAGPIIPNAANEFSVSFQPALGQYLMLYTQDSLSKHMVFRLAPQPEGPWSESVRFYRCPEVEWDPRIFCYAAKGHPEFLISPEEILVTYTTNSTDPALIESDARFYRPRFLRLRFRSP